MKNNKIFMIFDLDFLLPSHLDKDMFLVLSSLSKKYNLNAEILYRGCKDNKNMPNEVSGVTLTRVNIPFNSQCLKLLYYIFYLIKNASKSKIFVRYYFNSYTGILGSLYKILNHKGRFYVKADGIQVFSKLSYDKLITDKRIKTRIKCFFLRLIFKYADLISIETKKEYNRLVNLNPFGLDISGKTVSMRNGFDEDIFDIYKMKEKTFFQKENILLTVGRIGHSDKNNEMLLKALSVLTDTKGWKFYFIGPIEENFKPIINDFFKNNVHLEGCVYFTGPIYDKHSLWDYYNRSKVFVLTSPYESYALVLNEAYRFQNYIISTDVGIASELVDHGYGEIVPFDDFVLLNHRIQSIINDKSFLAFKYLTNIKDRKINSWKYLINRIDLKF